MSEKRVNSWGRGGLTVEWPATCNLKVKQRPTGSPLLLRTYWWELCKHAFWEHSGFLCLFPVLHCATMLGMTVNMKHGQIPMSQRPSDLPFNPYETKYQNITSEVLRGVLFELSTSLWNCFVKPCRVYMYVSISYVLVWESLNCLFRVCFHHRSSHTCSSFMFNNIIKAMCTS